jgi:hypothetical protein
MLGLGVPTLQDRLISQLRVSGGHFTTGRMGKAVETGT